MSNDHKPNTNEPVHRGTFTPTKPSAASQPTKLAINPGEYEQQSSQSQTQGPSGRVGGPYKVPDDRYTGEDPPEEGAWVWYLDLTPELYLQRYYTPPVDKVALQAGVLHRTAESAEGLAWRMGMVDEILEALEGLIKLTEHSRGFGWDGRWTRAIAVAAKARGEVGDE